MAGADDFLLKPFDIFQLKGKMGKFLDVKMMDRRFGIVAVEKGFITPDELVQVLGIQVRENIAEGKHRRIGDILLERELITSEQIEEVLGSLSSLHNHE